MKKIVYIVAIMLCASLTVQAAEKKKGKGKRPELTQEQKELMQELTKKYDTDGKKGLSADERAKISEEDQKCAKDAKLPGFGPAKKKKK